MSDDGISIFFDVPGSCRGLLSQALNGDDSIDSQEEVNRSVEAVYYSGDPIKQLGFHWFLSKKINEKGWKVPAQFQSAFELLDKQNKKFEKTALKKIGWAYLPVPFYLDVESAVKQYYPKGSYIKCADGNTQSILNEKGEIILAFASDGQCVEQDYSDFLPKHITKIYSPLTRRELSAELLWLPNYIHLQFSYILGLPAPTDDAIRDYVHERLDWEGAHKLYKEPDKYADYDPYCHVERYMTEYHVPKSIREAVKSECEEDPADIFFPNYGVTNRMSNKPVLKTHSLISCAGIAIYNRLTTDALLGHFTTGAYEKDSHPWPADLAFYYSTASSKLQKSLGEKTLPTKTHEQKLLGAAWHDDWWPGFRTAFSFEWYMGTFKSEYFDTSAGSSLEITIISTNATPDRAVKTLIDSARYYFPNATIRHANYDSSFHHIDFELDSRTGVIDYKKTNSFHSNEKADMKVRLVQKSRPSS